MKEGEEKKRKGRRMSLHTDIFTTDIGNGLIYVHLHKPFSGGFHAAGVAMDVPQHGNGISIRPTAMRRLR
jgi:hypothetical protein